MPLSVVYATDKYFGFAKNGNIPWIDRHLLEERNDLDFFKTLTKGNIVIMGKNTFFSLPSKSDGRREGLKNRTNVVISASLYNEIQYKEENLYPGIIIYSCIIEFLESDFFNKNKKKEMFIIGGKRLIDSFDKYNMINTWYITMFNKNYECDMFIKKEFDFDITKVEVISNITTKYVIENSDEKRFIQMIKDVRLKGKKRNMRANNAISYFCPGEFVYEFKEYMLEDGNLYYSFPLMTHRSCSLENVMSELMWIIRGQTDSNLLKVNVWKENTTREFLDSRGLNHLPVGDIGKSYGYQMRKYCCTDFDTDNILSGIPHTKASVCYKTALNVEYGFDQLSYVIDEIKRNPFSNRLIINLWNPIQMHEMSLPPCGFCYQFDVDPDDNGNPSYLNCRITQRSSDILLAGAWNIASCSLFLLLVASVTNLKPGRVIWSPGNTHIYENNLEIEEKIKYDTNPFPLINIREKKCGQNDTDEIVKTLESYNYSDIKLLSYIPIESIKINMNA